DEALATLNQGAESLRGPARLELLWTQANVLIDAKAVPQANDVIARLAKANAAPSWLDYLQARLHVLADRWTEAASLLERSGAIINNATEVGRQTDLLLAQCYERLNNREAQLAALDRLVGRDPGSAGAVTARAGTLATLGRLDDAILQYQQAQ